MRRSKCYTDELEKINRDESLKSAASRKLRFRITGFSQTEYSYLLSNKGYIVSHENYNISKSDIF